MVVIVKIPRILSSTLNYLKSVGQSGRRWQAVTVPRIYPTKYVVFLAPAVNQWGLYLVEVGGQGGAVRGLR